MTRWPVLSGHIVSGQGQDARQHPGEHSSRQWARAVAVLGLPGRVGAGQSRQSDGTLRHRESTSLRSSDEKLVNHVPWRPDHWGEA